MGKCVFHYHRSLPGHKNLHHCVLNRDHSRSETHIISKPFLKNGWRMAFYSSGISQSTVWCIGCLLVLLVWCIGCLLVFISPGKLKTVPVIYTKNMQGLFPAELDSIVLPSSCCISKLYGCSFHHQRVIGLFDKLCFLVRIFLIIITKLSVPQILKHYKFSINNDSTIIPISSFSN